MIIETTIVSLLDEGWGDWAEAVHAAFDSERVTPIALQMGFFCFEMEHFL